MFRLTSNIMLGEYMLAGVVSVEIESSWEMLTDTCKISLPAEIYHRGKFVNLAESRLIKKGDKVSVSLGYDDENIIEFTGFVTSVKSGAPALVECQDFAWLLKQGNKTLSFSNVKLQELISQIAPADISVQASNVGLGQFRITNATAAQVLEEIKKSYGLVSYMKGKVLYSGVTYPNVGNTHTFEFGKNIIEENSELIYQVAEDVRIKVKAISMMPDNKKIEIEIGDSDGELRTLNYYNLSKSDLEKVATEEAKKLRYDGYTGSFETFGAPSVQHGDVVKIIDPKFDRSGQYYVKKVIKTFSASGYRQKIEIDRKI